jgi:hypothetical protein
MTRLEIRIEAMKLAIAAMQASNNGRWHDLKASAESFEQWLLEKYEPTPQEVVQDLAREGRKRQRDEFRERMAEQMVQGYRGPGGTKATTGQWQSEPDGEGSEP